MGFYDAYVWGNIFVQSQQFVFIYLSEIKKIKYS